MPAKAPTKSRRKQPAQADAAALQRRKQRMRARQHRIRTGLGARKIAALSARISEHVRGLEAWQAARSVSVYLALPNEVQTSELLQLARAAGKTIGVPVYRPKAGAYAFAWLEDAADFRPGRLGILEPASARRAAPSAFDVILVPGLAFDRAGRRLGHGGGYYDRLLRVYRGLRVGLAFEAQMVRQVPTGPHDESVDVVVTERGVYDVSRSEDETRKRKKPARRRREVSHEL